MNIRLLFVMPLMAFLIVTACKNDDDNPAPPTTKGQLTTHFDLRWDPMNGVDFIPGDTFSTSSGDSLIIQEIRMWITNIKLYRSGSVKWEDSESYYLVEKTSTNEREQILLSGIPAGDYDMLEFSVGVDSAHNHSLDQKEGELDENEGMSWNWNSGYKFYVQNGSYFDGDSLNFQPLKLHIGLDQYFRTIQLSLPNTLSLTKNGNHEIHMMVGNGKTYNLPNVIDVDSNNGELQSFFPAPVYDNIVSNYSGMFMVHHVE